MPLEIIGAGFGRTGTLSTHAALNRLGFPCYHMFEVTRNPANRAHLDFWRTVANTPPDTAHDWEQVFGRYRAAVDNPACCVWRELLDAYPQARVLLTLHPRGAEAWYDSTIETIYFTENRWQFKVLEWLTPSGRRFGDMARKLIWQRSHRGTMDDRARALAHYAAHIEEVRGAVPPERLLVYSADQGWEPLCRFLGVPVPDEPFPNVNDRAELKRSIERMVARAHRLLAAAVIAMLALLAAAAWLLGT